MFIVPRLIPPPPLGSQDGRQLTRCCSHRGLPEVHCLGNCTSCRPASYQQRQLVAKVECACNYANKIPLSSARIDSMLLLLLLFVVDLNAMSTQPSPIEPIRPKVLSYLLLQIRSFLLPVSLSHFLRINCVRKSPESNYNRPQLIWHWFHVKRYAFVWICN